MRNRYELRGFEVVIYVNSKGSVLEVRVSLNKLDKLLAYDTTWSGYTARNGKVYIQGKIPRDKNRSYIKLSRFLLDRSQGQVWHSNGDTLDHTDANLVTIIDRDIRVNANSSSGHRGVTWYQRLGVWIVHIKVKGMKKYIGHDKDLDKAIKLRKEAERKYWS